MPLPATVVSRIAIASRSTISPRFGILALWLVAVVWPLATASAQTRRANTRLPLTEAVAAQENNDEQASGAQPEIGAEVESTAEGGGLVNFILENGVWIVGALVGLLGLVGIWAWLGGRKTTSEEDAALNRTRARSGSSQERFSSTRIQVSDVEERLGKTKETAVELDREYALVVDEEALRMPSLPDNVDENTGRHYAESGDIRKLLDENRFPEAYDRYCERIRRDTSLEFHSQLEQVLSEYFLRTRDFEKAARILEHHIATHAAEDVAPEIYFNLGYAHFLQKQPDSSRRFFELFVTREPDPTRQARARRILERLGSGPQKN